MSIHVIENDEIRWLFGWNQYNRSFYLTKHDKTLTEDENPIFQVGTRHREISDAEDLFILSMMAKLDIPYEVKLLLHQDKDYENRAAFVLHYPDEFVYGFRTDSLAHAELLKEALSPARPDQELQIRKVRA